MAILFSAYVSYSMMHVLVCLLEQYDVTSVFRALLLSRMIVTSFFKILFLFRYLIVLLFLLFPADTYPKNRDAEKKVRRQLTGLRLHVCGGT